MADFNVLKSPVFEGINDVPKVATETEAGNGSDLIARFNQLCEYLTTLLADVATTGEYGDLKNIPPAQIRVQVNGESFENVSLLIIDGQDIITNYSAGALRITLPNNSENNPPPSYA